MPLAIDVNFAALCIACERCKIRFSLIWQGENSGGMNTRNHELVEDLTNCTFHLGCFRCLYRPDIIKFTLAKRNSYLQHLSQLLRQKSLILRKIFLILLPENYLLIEFQFRDILAYSDTSCHSQLSIHQSVVPIRCQESWQCKKWKKCIDLWHKLFTNCEIYGNVVRKYFTLHIFKTVIIDYGPLTFDHWF